MIRIRKSRDRGHADHGWLDARHTFSFAGFYDPEFVHFSDLRVLNQDRIQAGQGFPSHPHNDMEIVTYVMQGVLRHEDSMGNGSEIRPGDVQLMSAGTGVVHSEYNASETETLHLLQMWVVPAEPGYEPRYEQKHFPVSERAGRLRLVVSPDAAHGSLRIGQDTRLFAGILDPGDVVQHALDAQRKAWVHVARGRVRLNGDELGEGDGAAVEGESEITLEGVEQAELVLWDLR